MIPCVRSNNGALEFTAHNQTHRKFWYWIFHLFSFVLLKYWILNQCSTYCMQITFLFYIEISMLKKWYICYFGSAMRKNYFEWIDWVNLILSMYGITFNIHSDSSKATLWPWFWYIHRLNIHFDQNLVEVKVINVQIHWSKSELNNIFLTSK
jgi:hypothetical protein